MPRKASKNQTQGRYAAMSESRFLIKFDGPAIENGEIDVADFAPAVLSLGELFKTTNQVFNNDRAEATIKLKATNEGSFEALLMLDVSFLEAASDFFSDRDKIAHAQEILNLVLGFSAVAGGAGGGLFWLLKTLKGKKPEAAQEAKGGVELTINGNVYLMDKGVIELYENPQIRQKVEASTRVLDRPGIENLSFISEEPEPAQLTIEKSERQYFSLPERDETEEETKELVEEKWLKALSIHFKEGNKWRFTDGENEFYASVEDVDFINKVDKGEIRFLKGDVYVCTVSTTQTLTAGGLKQERKIIKVLEHRSGAHQLKLL